MTDRPTDTISQRCENASKNAKEKEINSSLPVRREDYNEEEAYAERDGYEEGEVAPLREPVKRKSQSSRAKTPNN